MLYEVITLFLLTALSKMKEPKDGGIRIAIIHNGSPLFTGDAGSGPSEIRKYILENDLLETIVALPNDIFYNTGIATYIVITSYSIHYTKLYEFRFGCFHCNQRNDFVRLHMNIIVRVL